MILRPRLKRLNYGLNFNGPVRGDTCRSAWRVVISRRNPPSFQKTQDLDHGA
jgi:hypothetical protein